MSNSKKRNKKKVSSKNRNKRVNSKLGWTEGNKTISSLKRIEGAQLEETEGTINTEKNE
jgi:hypothetical protein